jgi:hypothetical protein
MNISSPSWIAYSSSEPLQGIQGTAKSQTTGIAGGLRKPPKRGHWFSVLSKTD